MDREVLKYSDEQIQNTKIIRTRYDIVNHIPPKDGGIGFLEIGTGSGDFANTICSEIEVSSLTILDTFEGYNDHLGRHGNSPEEQLEFITNRFSYINNLNIVSGNSLTALPDLYNKNPEAKYDFIYIDADHAFDNVYSDLCWSAKMIGQDGLIGIDDYCFKPKHAPDRDSYEVQEALSFFLSENPDWEIKFFCFNGKGFQNVFISRVNG